MSQSSEHVVAADGPPDDLIEAVGVRHPWRWVSSIVLLYLAIAFVHWIWTNDNVQWGVFRQYLAVSSVIRGLGWTMVLTVVSMAVGIVLGIVLAVMRMSKSPILSGIAGFYAWFFRGTPVFVQIILWFNIAALTGPKPPVGLPFTDVVFFHPDINSLITRFSAAILALGLNEAAYMSEIVRAGFLSVDEGQTEAAQSLGMSRAKTIWRIVLPQAMRVIVPPTGNETISMLKTTSLVSVIAFPEILYAVQNIYAVNYQVIPLLLVACFWYLILTTLLSIGQFYIERYYGRGASRHQVMTPIQRFRAMWSENLPLRRSAV
jgi:polar amino acid transport system permease protein